MSTRKKEGAPPGKEKRGTSPSNAGPGTGGVRRSPGPPKTRDSTPSGKSIPSYLKPTASSSSVADASKVQPGKKKPSPTTDKPTIERRRSFDKPPSPSRSTRSPASPNPTLRSSSFSGKSYIDPGATVARRRSFDKPPSPSPSTKSPISPSPVRRSSSTGRASTTLSKGVSERNLKGAKDAGKQSTLYTRPAASSVKKTSSVLTKKSEAGSGSLRKKRVESSPEKVESPDVSERELEPEPQPDDQECFVGAEEEPGYSLLEEEDVSSIIEQIEGGSHDNDAVIESPTVTEQRDATIESPSAIENQEDKIETVEPSTGLEHKDEDEVEEKSEEEISNQQEEDIKEETDQADNHDESGAGDPSEEKESGAGDPNEEKESGAGDPNEEKESSASDPNEEKESSAGDPNEEKEREEDDENEEAIEVDNDSKSNEQLEEKEEQEVVIEEKKEEEDDATPRVAHGKKDLTLSNDVIEETRNKLIEQRRNKVKALAGAFETVISLQDK